MLFIAFWLLNVVRQSASSQRGSIFKQVCDLRGQRHRGGGDKVCVTRAAVLWSYSVIASSVTH